MKAGSEKREELDGGGEEAARVGSGGHEGYAIAKAATDPA